MFRLSSNADDYLKRRTLEEDALRGLGNLKNLEIVRRDNQSRESEELSIVELGRGLRKLIIGISMLKCKRISRTSE